MYYKHFFSLLAVLLTWVAYYPYIRSVYQGTIKPHVFSWIIWGFTTCIACLAQLQDKGGAGAWPIGISGLITFSVAYLAYLKRSDSSISSTDWFFLILALFSLPLWYFTSDPLWAVVILTTADLLGFGPTIRQAWHFPFQENLLFFGLFAVRNILVIIALENYTLVTLLFPSAISLACILLIFLILIARMKKNRERSAERN